MPARATTILWALLAASSYGCAGATAPLLGCVPIDRAGYVVEKPGTYCVVKNLSTRADFADHSAEAAIVEIRSSHVVIDLLGHKISRGLLSGAGGNGIKMASTMAVPRIENVTIRNGSIVGFARGIYYYADHAQLPSTKRSPRHIDEHRVTYAPAQIEVSHIRFEDCPSNVDITDWKGP